MKNEVVIIGRNEGNYVNQMIKSLPEDWHKIYVADRCTDNTVDLLRQYNNVTIVETKNYTGRKTSSCRNLGLSYTDKDSNVLFLDGDRYIEEGDIKTVCENAQTDIVLLPLRKEIKRLFPFTILYGSKLNGFYSSGIFFKRNAINKVIEFHGEFFPTSVEHIWGIEDCYLGDICYHLGLTASVAYDIVLAGLFERTEIPIEADTLRMFARSNLKVKS